MVTFGTIVRRALTAGAVAGILLAAYTYFVLEPTIDDAIALEEAMSATAEESHSDEAAVVETDSHSHDEEEALFTRPEQVRGGMAATVLYALAASLVFGTVFAAVRHRLPGRDDLARSLWLAAMGFGAFALIPTLKYPANPPAVGDPDTVGERTLQWLALVAVAVVVMWALTRLRRALLGLDPGLRILIMTVASVVAFGLVLIMLPGTPDSIDPAVPAALIWSFRVQSLGLLALLWAVLGTVTGWLVAHDASSRTPEVAPATTT